MYVVVLKDFSAFKAGDVLHQKEDKKWFNCNRNKTDEHIDVINALPEYYCKVAESGADVIKEHNCSCMKTAIAIDPASNTSEGCCILSEYEGNAIRILECVPLHVCKCQKMFTEEDINNYILCNGDRVCINIVDRFKKYFTDFLHKEGLMKK